MSVEIIVNNELETNALGRALAETLPNGSVVALIGALGAGKTRLVQAVAQASGVPIEETGSPTFVLVREYKGDREIYHFDAYRLRDSDEFLALGAEEYFDSVDGVSFIEWADRVDDVIPEERIEVIIKPLNENARKITITARGDMNESLETLILARWRELVSFDNKDVFSTKQ